jgi:hypothetical protein
LFCSDEDSPQIGVQFRSRMGGTTPSTGMEVISDEDEVEGDDPQV